MRRHGKDEVILENMCNLEDGDKMKRQKLTNKWRDDKNIGRKWVGSKRNKKKS